MPVKIYRTFNSPLVVLLITENKSVDMTNDDHGQDYTS